MKTPQQLMRDYFFQNEIEFDIYRSSGVDFQPVNRPSHNLYSDDVPSIFARVGFSEDDVFISGTAVTDNLIEFVRQMWKDGVFYFTAQRYGIGRYKYGREDVLNSDASNLAGYLAVLQGERSSIFARLIGHVREIFSNVGNLSVTTTPDGFDIRVWPTEESLNPILSFSLEESGTGVAQVVAILAVIMTTEQAVIVIDEISSFLHPRAAKSLLRIMSTIYSNNQYIISTHSHDVISHSSVSTMHIVKKFGYCSQVKSVLYRDIHALREIGEELGISMTDVFAANKIVWVEGQTEEACFPFILEKALGRNYPQGLIFSAVIATGDFGPRKRDREVVIGIYKKLTSEVLPLSNLSAFSFDREKISQEDAKNIETENKGLLFLPARHYECFLINVSAIHALIVSECPEIEIDIDLVDRELRTRARDPKYDASKEWNGDFCEGLWFRKVNAAKLIGDSISTITQARLEFDKVRHSLFLTKFIFENIQEKNYVATELKNYILSLIDIK
ncbi:ATP-dependent nuclease [Methylobacterium hispanicum]|uniref:ATP-dependent nuclease n=1 Tax=Methylobacterium hispanicum TaxID=270350 RepID=UPI002F35015A